MRLKQLSWPDLRNECSTYWVKPHSRHVESVDDVKVRVYMRIQRIMTHSSSESMAMRLAPVVI
jgi:hypothetical protein